jgi:hypothetical protein
LRKLSGRTNLSLMLRCCTYCMGDLEFRSDSTGDHYICLQCNERAETPKSKIGRLARIGGDLLPRTGLTAS